MKLKLNNISIGKRIVSLSVIALIGILSIFAIISIKMNSINKSEVAYSSGATLKSLIADINISALNMRRAEKDFLLRKNEKYIAHYREDIAKMRKYLKEVPKYTSDDALLKKIQDLINLSNQHSTQFTLISDLSIEIGLKETDGLKQQLRLNVHDIENALKALPNNGSLMIKMLMMRRHEKDYMLRTDIKYEKNILDRNVEFKELLKKVNYSVKTKAELNKKLTSYVAIFQAYVQKQIKFDTTQNKLSEIYEKMTLDFKFLIKKATSILGQKTIEMEKGKNSAITIIIIMSLVVLIIVFSASWWIIKSIIHPLNVLNSSVLAITSGDYDNEVPGKDRLDELGTISSTLDDLRLSAKKRIQLEKITKEETKKRREEEVNRLKAESARILKEEQRRQKEKDAQQAALMIEKEKEARLIAKLEGKKELSRRVFQLERSEVLLEKQASDLITLSQDLKVERDKANEATHTKSNFLASMSHEIRTPMNGILGMIGLLLDTRLTKKQKTLADDVQYSADNLLVIINEILDFSKLESGSTELEINNFDINHTITSSMNLLRPVAEKANVDLSFTLAKGGLNWLKADQARIRQIIINLVGNAIKFSYDGEVAVSCTSTPLKDDQIELLVEIKDTGIGISDEQMANLFERFSQADNSISRKFGGTGLGLSICKELIKLMDGEIDVESEINVGSKFWFKITCPLGSMRAVQKKEPLKFALSSKSTQYTILVAEDNFINQRLIGNLLVKFKHKFEFANDGLEALKMIQKTKYDLVLMDIQMPHMDGITATKEIRKLKTKTADLPIIALTANVMEDMENEYYTAGMDDFISKPIDTNKFFGTIERVMNKQKKKKSSSKKL